MSESEEEGIPLLQPNSRGENYSNIGEEEVYKYKPEISEEVKKQIDELYFPYLSSSKVDYKNQTFKYINTLNKENEEDYKILNYLLVWAILFKDNVEKNNDIIKKLQEKGAKLNTDYEEDSELVRSVVRQMSVYKEVIENIRNSIVPEITEEDWEGLIEDYKKNQKSPEEDEPPKQAANLQIRGAEEIQPQSVNPPTVSGWYSFFSKPANPPAGGGGGKPKQYGGFRKKYKNSKYKTKKFKKIYKKKKHNRKTRKYK
jgi:hypothetical protein